MFGQWRPKEDGHVKKMKAIAEVQFLGEVRWDWMRTVGSRRTGGMERRGSLNLSGIWIKIVPLTSVGQVGPHNGVPGDVLCAEYHPSSKASGPGERGPVFSYSSKMGNHRPGFSKCGMGNRFHTPLRRRTWGGAPHPADNRRRKDLEKSFWNLHLMKSLESPSERA